MRYTKTKRIFDVSLALILGIVMIPVVMCIVVAIKLTSPGPVLFRQKRLGLNGEIFLMNKFRKFPSNWGSKGPSVTLQGDSRMTRIGSILERTKLDELPQLWNILLGEMSFVGPRPESLSFAHLFKGEYQEVLNFKPGIFGPNQTAYRNESTMYPPGEDPVAFYERELFPAKARQDLTYFRNSSFMGDIKWILHGTVALVLNAIVWRKSMRPSIILLMWDIAAVVFAWLVMHWLKFSVWRPSVMTENQLSLFKIGFLVLPIALLFVFTVTRVYRHPVRYFSSTDAYRLLGFCCFVWMLSTVVLRFLVVSGSSLLISAACIFSMALMCLPRVSYQQLFKRVENRKRQKVAKDKVRVAVCGVEARTVSLCNLLTVGFETAEVVGIISDDIGHVRREIRGIEVIGLWSDLDVLLARYNFEQLWVADKLKPRVELEVSSWCHANNVQLVELNQLPGFASFTSIRYPAAKSSIVVPATEVEPNQSKLAV